MPVPRPAAAFKVAQTSTSLRPFRTFAASSIKLTDDWKGRKPEEHVTNQEHEHNIHAGASKSGQRAKAEDHSHDGEHKNSHATSEKSTTTAREEEAKSGRKDRGMGLQDERGGVSLDAVSRA